MSLEVKLLLINDNLLGHEKHIDEEYFSWEIRLDGEVSSATVGCFPKKVKQK